ncbi:MAG: hypothetical protein P4L49_06020 [Desulfosporosinus sp.]|nr:hypothetical protein [Desulfosporosinus sp.]
MINILHANFTTRKHWLVLITLLLGFSILLIGCSSLTKELSNQSTSTSAIPTPTDTSTSTDTSGLTNTPIPTDKTIPSVTATPADTNSEPSTTSQTASQVTKTPPATANEKKNSIAISKAKYNQLKYGDTYEKIKGLLGSTGEITTENGIKGSKSYTVTYLIHVKSPSGAEVFLAFKDDKLVNKMEVNLQ